MNFADIEKTWQSPHNRPDPAALEIMKNEFIAEHDRSRTNQKRFLFFVGFLLTYLTIRFTVGVLRPEPGSSGIDLTREWGAVLFLLLPWIALGFLGRQLSRHDREHGAPARTLADSVRALLDENRVSRARVKIVACLHGVLLLVLPLVVYQLRAVGKAGDEILLPAFVGWPVVAIGILLAMRWHYRKKLLPRKERLEEVLRSYE